MGSDDSDPQVRPANLAGAAPGLLRCLPMSTPPDTARKVQQLDNDVVEIYGKLDEIQDTQRRHGDRLKTIETRVDGLDTKVTNLDTKVTELDAKVGDLDTKVGDLDTKIDFKVTALDRRLTGKLDEVIGLLERGPSRRRALRWRR